MYKVHTGSTDHYRLNPKRAGFSKNVTDMGQKQDLMSVGFLQSAYQVNDLST